MNQEIQIKTKPNLGKRITAGIVDYLIIFAYFGLMLYLFGQPNENKELSVDGLPGFSIMIFWFLMTIGMEQLIGATIGNKLQDLKPISKLNPDTKISFSQSLKRHLLALIDFQIFGLIGILTIKKTERNQRLGDLWADTIVIDTQDSEQGIMIKN